MSYVYYYIGHIISLPMRWDCFAWLNPAYQYFMDKSYVTQINTGKGPWE